MPKNAGTSPKMKTDAKFYASHSENDTRRLGYDLGRALKPGVVVLLCGDLGAGKTVFVRGVGEAFGVKGVRSPSFTIINEYESPSGVYVIHADLYRLDSEGVNAVGLDEYAGANDSVLFVEWPERWSNPPANEVMTVRFEAVNENERRITITAEGAKAEEALRLI